MRLTEQEIQLRKSGMGLVIPGGCRIILSSEIDNLLDTIEALQRENEQLQAQAARMREALENITEYWNGDSNEIAMMDACTNNRETAHEALAAIAEVEKDV